MNGWAKTPEAAEAAWELPDLTDYMAQLNEAITQMARETATPKWLHLDAPSA